VIHLRARLGAALVLTLAASPAPAASLARLADAFAAELQAAARGAAVELDDPQDRTGTALGADLMTLVRARLRERGVEVAPGGIHAAPVLAFEGDRLVLSARVTRGLELVDIVTVSVARDEAALALARVRSADTGTGLDVVGAFVSPPLSHGALALSWLDADRLLVADAQRVFLYRREGQGLRRESEARLPASVASRWPGARLETSDGSRVDAWTTLCPLGRRFRVGATGRLEDVGAAGELPVFVPGTNLLVAEPPRLAAHGQASVDSEGWLWWPGRQAVRTGGALALPWDDVALASSSGAPSGSDEVLVVRMERGAATVSGRIPVEGDVRAIAARADGPRATVAIGLTSGGATLLQVLELARPDADEGVRGSQAPAAAPVGTRH
jgi:hypothetical protein